MPRNPVNLDFIKHWHRSNEEIRQLRLRRGAVGTAFLIDADGLITTNPDASGMDFDANDGDIEFQDFVFFRDGISVTLNASFQKNIIPHWKAVNQAVSSGATTLSVSFSGLSLNDQNDASFAVLVTPQWDTTVWVTSKATTGFTINFGTAPGADSALDWLIVR